MKGMALILYNNIEYAQAAVKDTKGWKIGGSKIKVDFANQESQMAFYRSMQASGQDIRDFYDIVSERRDDRRTQYEYQAERQYYENVRTSRTYTDDSSRKYATRSREFYTEWDPYQGDYYETQYFEDPREFRDYRADPYEQDIRKYSYLQRTRERERERFETDRGRDHSRRTIERSQSPSHITSRRPATPAASPPPLERIPVCCRSSDRSGSCSSISPPRFEKPEKSRPEKYNKSEKTDKERVFETERGNLVDKEKRLHKERGDKEKRLKKSKNGLQVCESKSDLDSDTSPDSSLRNNYKICKDSASKGRLDLLPCVVQLTRVKEKEGKLLSYAVEKCKDESDSPQLTSPLSEQRSPLFNSEPSKGNISKHGKHRDGAIQIIDRDQKNKPKKQGKSDVGFDVAIVPDVDRLAARKRRFEDTGLVEKLKKNREDDSSDSRHHKAFTKETEADTKKMHKKENHKERCVQHFSKSSPQSRDHEGSMELPLECQSRVREYCKNSSHLKEACEELKEKLSNDSLDMNVLKEQKFQRPENERGGRKWGDWDVGEDSFSDRTSLSNRQTEQIQWFMQKLSESERLGKLSNQFLPCIDKEKDCFLSDSGVTIQKTENEISSGKQNNSDNFEFAIENKNIGLHFEGSQRQNEVSYMTSPTEGRQCSASAKEDVNQTTAAVPNKERKSPSQNQFSTTELKDRFHLTSKALPSTDPDQSKVKTTTLGGDEMQHWKQNFKTEVEKVELTDRDKQRGIPKHLGQDLEPGEVQSDSDEEFDTKHFSPSSNSSLSFILRERDERMTDLKLSASLEKNKFYSFALDKTITPDTKALLERAKTLYSTREDNWSFLPSCFPTSHSCSEKNKEEIAPRPIPSWYMKKKKIRTDSVEKMSSKHEELKSQDPERQELYASRFLHSSIFEQDSRRLKHLERKSQDVEPGVCKVSKPDITKVQRKSAVADTTQEPIVLFHSRFLELQQQKDKDNSSTENEALLADVKRDEVQNDQTELEKVPESAIRAEDQSSSPQLTLTLCTSVPLNEESTLPTTESSANGKTLKVEPSSSVLLHELKQPSPKVSLTLLPVNSEVHSESDTKLKETKKEREHTFAEEIPEERSLNPSVEKKTKEIKDSDLIEDKTETVRNELKIDQTKVDTKHIEGPVKSEEDIEECVPEQVTESKPVKSCRQSKSKRSKKLSVLRASKATHGAASGKPATRKSERIDKEKLKKAETPKLAELKTSTKSQNSTSDSEQKVESSLIQGRTRRRNVRSVYATLREVDEEAVQSSRLTRKRAAFKDLPQDNPPPVSRRGRPPKRGIKRSEATSSLKVDQRTTVNPEVKETDVAAVTASEGCRPRSQRVNSSPYTAIDKKANKTDVFKRSGTKSISIDQIDEENEQIETKPKDPEIAEKPSEKADNGIPLICKKDLDSGGYKTEETGVEHNLNLLQKSPEKSAKTKTAWVKRNMKLEERSHNLKNLEIRVSVDDVKGLLRSEDIEQDSCQNSILKTKMVVQEKAEPKSISIGNQNLCLESKEEEMLAESDEITDPTAAFLAQQIELEQAVENIAKLTVEHPSRPFKESSNATPTILPPVNVEPEEAEEEKRANPASETELAAAIDSITTEVSCTDGDGFTGSSTYPAVVPTSSSSAPTPSTAEANARTAISSVIVSDPDSGSLTPSQGLPLHETCKKTSKVQTKSSKRPRGRKTIKREDVSDKAVDLQPSPSKLPESIPEDPETLNPKGITVTAATSAAATVVTAVATCRRDVISSLTVDTPKEAEQPEVEQPVPKESACHSGTFHASTFKKHPLSTDKSNPAIALNADLKPGPQHNLSQKVGKIPHWAPKPEESRIYVAPACHVTVVTPSLQSATLGSNSANPPLPPDTKASDIDPSSSTLRKILMEPKYVSASSTSAIAISTTVTTSINTTVVTSTLSDPLRMSDKPQLYSEERPFQAIHHKPSPLTESQQNYREKPHNASIPSPTTSVISRIPLPYDSEETPRISLSSRNISQTIPRQKQRSSSNENTRFNSMGIVEEGKRGRLLSDAASFNSASVPGLRVNTSEGVVVLSYSGQKTEGPQRMRAKISQIPQASVVDVEFQQSLSKSQLKQETSQSSSPKVISSPLAYGHTGGQIYNAQNVITTTKQNSLDKSEAPYHSSSQGGVVKMFQQPGPPHVLTYNQPVIHQHGKRALVHEPPTKKIDSIKGVQAPVMCPPHPPLSGTCMSPSPGIPIDRSVVQGNQEPQSPRSAVQSPPPYHKTCSISNSPIGTSAVLGHTVSTYPTIHHTHLEQSSVIFNLTVSLPHGLTVPE
uniref:Spen family transcriptional repressor n=1 Tax=Neogobius melanostomus TaxID=47308 RepID=A0A8C6TC62_9GOBI